MHNVMYDAAVPMPSGFMQLVRVWEVQADLSYHTRWPSGFPAGQWILLRTLGGSGLVELTGGRRIECGAGSLLLLTPAHIRSYRCTRPLWTFWWLECGTGSAWPFPLDTLMQAPVLPRERERLEACARGLRQGSAAAALCSAELLLMCHQWRAAGAGAATTDTGASRRVHEVMHKMAATADRPAPLAQLAREAHLSEGYFRRLFNEIAGCSPKAYYENARLARAVPWLQAGEMKLAEIAERLSYSSAFHFSRAFKKRYGRPPSDYSPRYKGKPGEDARGS